MHSWLSPVHVPTPSRTAKAGVPPSIQSLHRARIWVSLVGSKLTMEASILRPLMPPASLMSLTKRSIALVCSEYSTSPAKPKLAASDDRLETGKTTLMLRAVTPALLVLAWTATGTLLGVDGGVPELLDDPMVAASAMPTTSTTAVAAETICTTPERRRNRRHDLP